MISRERIFQANKKLKKRLKYYFHNYIWLDNTHAYQEKDNRVIEFNPFIYRSTGSPCNCWMCTNKREHLVRRKKKLWNLKECDEY